MSNYGVTVGTFGEFTIDFEAVTTWIFIVLPDVFESNCRNEIFLFNSRILVQLYAFLVSEDHRLPLYFENYSRLLGIHFTRSLVNSDFFETGGIITGA